MTAERDNKIRFQLRPTVVGEAIMDRLGAQGVDRNAESRRWIELGFAAEQAGFRLDGVELRHADRAWHVQPSLHGTVPAEIRPAPQLAPQPVAKMSAEPPKTPAPEVIETRINSATLPSTDFENSISSASGDGAGSLASRLRGLSAQ